MKVLRDRYEKQAREDGREPEEEIASLVNDESADYGEFWERAKTNLRAGRIRLVFVADKIPTELQRIVEFLNEQMSPADVLAVEIRRYVGVGEEMLVPRVLGQTAETRQKKSPGGSRPSRRWDEQSFLAETGLRAGQVEADVARAILEDWSREAFPIRWGKGGSDGTAAPALDVAGSSYVPFYLITDGRIEINFLRIATQPPFDQVSERLDLLRRLNDIPAVDLPESAVTRRPQIPLATFAPPDALAKLFGVIEWFRAEAITASP